MGAATRYLDGWSRPAEPSTSKAICRRFPKSATSFTCVMPSLKKVALTRPLYVDPNGEIDWTELSAPLPL